MSLARAVTCSVKWGRPQVQSTSSSRRARERAMTVSSTKSGADGGRSGATRDASEPMDARVPLAGSLSLLSLSIARCSAASSLSLSLALTGLCVLCQLAPVLCDTGLCLPLAAARFGHLDGRQRQDGSLPLDVRRDTSGTRPLPLMHSDRPCPAQHLRLVRSDTACCLECTPKNLLGTCQPTLATCCQPIIYPVRLPFKYTHRLPNHCMRLAKSF